MESPNFLRGILSLLHAALNRHHNNLHLFTGSVDTLTIRVSSDDQL